MLSLIFLPIYLTIELALLPFRLISYLFRSAVGFYALMFVGVFSLISCLFNIFRPLMGIVCLAAGLSLLYKVFQEKGGMDWLNRKLSVLRAR